MKWTSLCILERVVVTDPSTKCNSDYLSESLISTDDL